MSKTTPEQRQEWMRLHKAATPEWSARIEEYRCRVGGKIRYPETPYWLSVLVLDANGPSEAREANVRFAVAAYHALPLLIADLDAQPPPPDTLEELADRLEQLTELLTLTQSAFALAVKCNGGELRLPLAWEAEDVEITRYDDPQTMEAVYRVKEEKPA